jgi:hypothetical protein
MHEACLFAAASARQQLELLPPDHALEECTQGMPVQYITGEQRVVGERRWLQVKPALHGEGVVKVPGQLSDC